MSPPVAATRSPRRTLDGHVAFTARHVHAGDGDANRVAQTESPTSAAPREAHSRGIQDVVVVQVRAQPDEAFDRNIVQLHEESVRIQPGDDTRTFIAESPLEISEALDFH